MCTAIFWKDYAGRNLDIDKSHGEKVIITPRGFNLEFKRTSSLISHYAIIGMGIIANDYPLYFDAANERGLYMAGLSYLGNAKYLPILADRINLAPYELIPYILARCCTVKEAEYELKNVNLVDVPFSVDMPTAQLHFFIADKGASLVVEPDATGLNIYKNPIGVLTNNPPFPMQIFNLNNYMILSSGKAENRFAPSVDLKEYSFGMGAIGLPGDLSSSSRFVRAAFHRSNSNGTGNLSDIFHLLSSVAMPDGSVKLDCGYERTEYTSAVDLSRLIYSYRVYESPNTYAVKLREENLDSSALISYDLKREKEPYFHNGPYRNTNI